jgi:threonyl-tRNA synthetase
MAAVSVRLPDGSTKEFDERGTTALQFAESIGRRLAKAAVAATFDGVEVDLDTPLVDGARGPSGHRRFRRRAGGAPPLDRARDGPGGPPAVAGGALRHRTGHRGRLLLRLRAPRIQALLRTRTCRRSRRRCARSSPPTSPSSEQEHSVDEGLALFAGPAIQAGDHRGESPRPTDAADPDFAADGRRRRGGRDDVPQHPRVQSTCAAARTCPRPAGSGTSGLTRVAGARTGDGDEQACQQLQRIYGTAWESAPRRSPITSTDSKRLSGATTAGSAPSSTCSHFPPRDRLAGSPVFHPKGATRPPTDGGLLAADARRPRLRAGVDPAYHEVDALRVLGSPELVRERACTRPWRWRAPPVLPEADELPDAHPHLQGAGGGRIASCPSGTSSSGPSTASSVPACVHGLTRVRCITQDDAHIFLRAPSRSPGSFARCSLSSSRCCAPSGSPSSRLELSTRPETSSSARLAEWDQATEALRSAARGGGDPLRRRRRGEVRSTHRRSTCTSRDAIGRTLAAVDACRSTFSCRSASISASSAPTTSGTGPR